MSNIEWTTDPNTGRITRGKLVTDEFTITFITQKNSWERDETKKTRVFIDGEETVDFTEAHEMQKANGYAPMGTHPEEDALFAKLNRQVVRNMRAVLVAGMDVLNEHLDHSAEDLSYSFSRKAGCSMCPCSPGFIITSKTDAKQIASEENGHSFTNVWISKN